MARRDVIEAGQMSLSYPDLVPGDQVRFPHRRATAAAESEFPPAL